MGYQFSMPLATTLPDVMPLATILRTTLPHSSGTAPPSACPLVT